MRPVHNRLRKIDIYSAEEKPNGYVGTKPVPKLLGYIYAEVQPRPDVLVNGRAGASAKQSAKLFLRPDAGIKCGDLVTLYGKTPDSRITEVKRAREYASATAVRL